MASKKYSLSSEKDDNLELKWKGAWNDLSLFYQGKKLLDAIAKSQLIKGITLDIKGKNLEIVMKKMYGIFPELHLSYGGIPVSGAANDPYFWVRQIFFILLFLGSLNLILGILGWIFEIEVLQNLGIGTITFVYGGLLILLAFGVKRFWRRCLFLALFFMVADFLLMGYFIVFTGRGLSGFLVKLLIILFVLRGISAMNQIKKLE